MKFPLPSLKFAVRHYFRLRTSGLSSLDLESREKRGRSSHPQEAKEEMLTDFGTLAAAFKLSPRERVLLFLDCFLEAKPRDFASVAFKDDGAGLLPRAVAEVRGLSEAAAKKELHRVKTRLGRELRAKGIVARRATSGFSSILIEKEAEDFR